jgi:hypothetical protein
MVPLEGGTVVACDRASIRLGSFVNSPSVVASRWDCSGSPSALAQALTLTEREDISQGIASGSSIRAIAKRLDRAASTGSRRSHVVSGTGRACVIPAILFSQGFPAGESACSACRNPLETQLSRLSPLSRTRRSHMPRLEVRGKKLQRGISIVGRLGLFCGRLRRKKSAESGTPS